MVVRRAAAVALLSASAMASSSSSSSASGAATASASALAALSSLSLSSASAPRNASFNYAPGFLSDGNDVLVGAPGAFSLASAEAWCAANASCVAFTYAGGEGAIPAAASVYFKTVNFGVTLDANWSAYTLATPPGPLPPTCPYLLMPYFHNDLQSLNYAVTRDGQHFTVLNGGAAVLNSTPTLRDPFMNRAPDGTMRLVATNGDANNNVLTWSSADAGVSWSPLRQLNVMQQLPAPSQVHELWAPEWIFDEARGAFMLFWAARGTSILPALPRAGCNGTQDYRFGFFYSYTTDWLSFTDPQVLFDPGCHFDGDGGIDGDIVRDEKGRFVLVYKDARGRGEGHDAELLRGIRTVTSDALTGPYLQADVSELLVPTLVEAPELHRSPVAGWAGWFLWFDCSFWPVPSGWERPPYGFAHSDTLVAPDWHVIPGACTGNTTFTAPPNGATHGSFLCISQDEHDALVARYPPPAA